MNFMKVVEAAKVAGASRIIGVARDDDKLRRGFNMLTLTSTYKTNYGAFTLDIKSMLNEKSRWHPRYHPMLNGGEFNIK